MSQAFNPYLPQNEYIPDGEPYIFGDRVYVYGSHDKFNAPIFCVKDYVCYSAPVDDLSDWRYEGVIFKKNQDPKNKLGLRLLFAPDVAVGSDGRYYLYYAFDFMGIMGVAVCDTPAGQYEFYGYVQYKDGRIWGRRKGDQFPFDPGVFVDDDGRVYLYSGFQTAIPSVVTGGINLKNDGGCVLELEADMITIKEEQKVILPIAGKEDLTVDCPDTASFQNHEFFEASSMRKIDGKYYYVYSSKNNHEICYAISDRPNGGFTYGGTLVDLGDLYMDHDEKGESLPEICINTSEEHASNYLGNTHGGMVEINGQWYIFYHRHTNRHSYSRQACAEKLYRNAEGKFLQAEVTSCGLNEGPLAGIGKYEARIACNLWSKEGTGRYDGKNPGKTFRNHPYFTQSKKEGYQYIANMQDGAVCGFKYFSFEGENREIFITVRGSDGEMEISTDPKFSTICGTVRLKDMSTKWITRRCTVTIPAGTKPLYFRYKGQGKVDFLRFRLK